MSELPTPPALPAHMRQKNERAFRISDMLTALLLHTVQDDMTEEILFGIVAAIMHDAPKTGMIRVVEDGAHLLIVGSTPESMDLNAETMHRLMKLAEATVAARKAATQAN